MSAFFVFPFWDPNKEKDAMVFFVIWVFECFFVSLWRPAERSPFVLGLVFSLATKMEDRSRIIYLRLGPMPSTTGGEGGSWAFCLPFGTPDEEKEIIIFLKLALLRIFVCFPLATCREIAACFLF